MKRTSKRLQTPRLLLSLLAIVLVNWAPAQLAIGQGNQPGSNQNTGSPETGFSQAELQQLAENDAATSDAIEAPTSTGVRNSLNFLSLLMEGGWLMIPIAAMSLLVVAMSLERFVAVRSTSLLPRGLRREIRKAPDQAAATVPPVLYTASIRYRSAAGRILHDVIMKSGRPIPEAEATIADGCQREADRLYGNVRWLSLAAAVTPLIGLLGTVWGMIIAFYNTTQLGAGVNKAEYLAEGIYVALVTTLGGLAVAIPAAIFAHFFEGRITRLMAKIDAELRNLLPVLERLEGKGRFDASTQQFVRRLDEAAEPQDKAGLARKTRNQDVTGAAS